MAIKITDLTAQDSARPLDWLMMVDREDESMSEWGTNKKIAVYHMAQSMIDMIPSSYFLNKKIVGYEPGITGEITQQDTILTTFSKLKSFIDTKAPILNPRFLGTVEMPSQTTIGDVSSDEISYLNGVTSSIQSQINTKAPINNPTFTGTVVLPTGSLTTVPIRFVAGPLKTETVSGAVEYDGTKFYITHNSSPTPVRRTIATETFVTEKISDLIDGAPEVLDTLNELAFAINDDSNYATTVTNLLALKAPSNNPIFSGTVTLPGNTSIGNVSSTEISYLDGVTSPIQAQITTKAPIDSPEFIGAVTLPSNTTIGTVDSAEISHLNGVTSPIQAQLEGKASAASVALKANINSPSFTGTVTLPTGTSLEAPIKFASGTLSTNPIAGAMEYDGTNFYITRNSGTATRNTIAFLESPTFSGTVTAPTFSGTLSGSATSAGSATNFTGSLAGDVTGTQGVTTILASVVTGKALTGLVTTYTATQTIAATDTVLSAIGKIVYNNTLKANSARPVFTAASNNDNGQINIRQNNASALAEYAGYVNFTNESDHAKSYIGSMISTDGSANIVFGTSVTGSIRPAATATETVRISPTGVLLIGTTSVGTSNSKLIVNGATTTTGIVLSGTGDTTIAKGTNASAITITLPTTTGTLSLTNHTHGNISSDGKIGSAANLPLITTTSGTIATGTFGTAANSFCAGNDSRIDNLHTVEGVTTATRSITNADNNKYIRCTTVGGTALTLDGSGAWTVGMTVTIRRHTTAGALSLGTTSATINDNSIADILGGDTFSLKCIDTSVPTNKVFDFI